MEAPTMTAVPAEAGISSSAATRVVVIDNNFDRRRVMSYVVEHGGVEVSVVGHADGCATALETIDRLKANVALLEIQLPTAEGLDTISALRRDHPALRIIVCSFQNDAAPRLAALSRGADSYLTKPISPRDLYRVLRPPALSGADLVES
jgi:CheY-like chemotaxis protein